VSETIDPRTDIGHVHLKVADLDRAIRFYRDVLGFELKQQMADQAAFLARPRRPLGTPSTPP
jgi:catechol 2,3-dioxygenase